jgi:hypothetical protein
MKPNFIMLDRNSRRKELQGFFEKTKQKKNSGWLFDINSCSGPETHICLPSGTFN